jgi:hypothetical protein
MTDWSLRWCPLVDVHVSRAILKSSSYLPQDLLWLTKKFNCNANMQIAASTFTLIFLCTFASADRMIRVLFNNGTEPSSDLNCTENDSLLIDSVFNVLSSLRNLRSIGHGNNGRRLRPVYCKNNCRGYSPLTCRATNCVGYRRELDPALVETIKNVTCSAQILSSTPYFPITTLPTVVESY